MSGPIAIGAFSRIKRLSTKALRLYDEMGLLTPARVDPATGYRYYHLEQTTQEEVIRALRAVEMPLFELQM